MVQLNSFILYVVVYLTASIYRTMAMLSTMHAKKSFQKLQVTSGKEITIRGTEWARMRGMEPGFGGIWPGDPDAPKFKVTVRSKKTGDEFVLDVPSDRYIFFYFEEQGIELPVVNIARMCRQGCCTICTGKIMNSGKAKMDAPLGLLKELRDEGYTLTCCTMPRSELVLELQDEDETFIRQWSDGFEGGGVEWGGFFPDEDE